MLVHIETFTFALTPFKSKRKGTVVLDVADKHCAPKHAGGVTSINERLFKIMRMHWFVHSTEHLQMC